MEATPTFRHSLLQTSTRGMMGSLTPHALLPLFCFFIISLLLLHGPSCCLSHLNAPRGACRVSLIFIYLVTSKPSAVELKRSWACGRRVRLGNGGVWDGLMAFLCSWAKGRPSQGEGGEQKRGAEAVGGLQRGPWR